MEKKEVLGDRCIVPLGPQSRSAARQRTGFWFSRGAVPSRRGTQRRRRTVPTAISAAGDYFCAQPVFRNQQRLQGNVLCRSAWLCLRGVAATECAILPIRELAAFPRGSACEHSSSGGRPSERRSLPASVLLDDFGWQSDPVPRYGSSGNGRQLLLWANRQCPRLRAGSLEIQSGCGRRLLQPLTGERPVKGFLCVRKNDRTQHVNLAHSLVGALLPPARVSDFLGFEMVTSLKATSCSHFSIKSWF